MKNILLGTILALLTANTFATGGFYCVTSEFDNQVEIWGTTGRVAGNPIVGEVGANESEGPQLMYTKAQVVGYWNMGDTFKIALLDEEAMKLDYVIEAKIKTTSEGPVALGTLELANGDTSPVTCTLE